MSDFINQVAEHSIISLSWRLFKLITLPKEVFYAMA